MRGRLQEGPHQSLELALEVQDLILRGDEVLGVQVAVAAHGLVQVLLLPQLRIVVSDLPPASQLSRVARTLARNVAQGTGDIEASTYWGVPWYSPYALQ